MFLVAQPRSMKNVFVVLDASEPALQLFAMIPKADQEIWLEPVGVVVDSADGRRVEVMTPPPPNRSKNVKQSRGIRCMIRRQR